METTFVSLSDMEVRTADDRHFIEGICVPWGRRTDRVAVPECFDRGAFTELVQINKRIKLTDYNHSRSRVPVGYSTAFEDRDAGLWARFRLNKTPEGESAHANSVEGVYGGLSVGFVAQGEQMRAGVRHVTAARLDHVSLVEVPAYEDATITAVRGGLDDEIAEWRKLANRSWDIDTRPRTPHHVLMAKIRLRVDSQ